MAELLSNDAATAEGTGTLTWQSNTNATVSRSTDYAHGGTQSYKAVAIAAAQTDVELTPVEQVSVTPGQTVNSHVWLRNTVAHYPTVYLRFYDSGGGLISDITSSPVESITAWYQWTGSGTVPANAAKAKLHIQMFAMSVGDAYYWDDASIDDGAGAGATVAGAKATETDTAAAGTPRVVAAGAQAVETDTANSGVPRAVVVGAKALEADAANAGTARVVVGGAQALETDTANAGTPVTAGAGVTVVGNLATETATAMAGSVNTTVPGSQAGGGGGTGTARKIRAFYPGGHGVITNRTSIPV